MTTLGKTFVAMTAGAALLVGAAAVADMSVAVKDRQDNMKRFGGNMKAIAQFVKSDEGTAADVAVKAAEIADWATDIPTWFPEGSSMDHVADPKTGAKPDIWQDWEKFKSAARNMSVEASKLAGVAKQGDKDAIAAQFEALGKKGCGGCHQPFREKI